MADWRCKRVDQETPDYSVSQSPEQGWNLSRPGVFIDRHDRTRPTRILTQPQAASWETPARQMVERKGQKPHNCARVYSAKNIIDLTNPRYVMVMHAQDDFRRLVSGEIVAMLISCRKTIPSEDSDIY